jgi:hypothetical protein
VNRLGLAGLIVLLLVGAGCMTRRITNLTPRQTTRAADGLYRFEVRWDSNQRAIREDSFKPYVVVEMGFHPMQRTLLTTNRWEALVPLPADRKFVNYHFKFDYQYNSFGKPRPDSRTSPTYQLEVLEP